jgi:hypothetical protein
MTMTTKAKRNDRKGPYGTDSNSPIAFYFTLLDAGALESLSNKLLHQTGISNPAMADWDDHRVKPDVPTAMKLLFGLVYFNDFPDKEATLANMAKAIRENS